MKSIFLKLIAVQFSLLLSNIATAQEYKIVYDYDNSGNRILREQIVLEPLETLQQQLEDFDTAAYFETELSAAFTNEVTGSTELKIFPNPVFGVLKLEISGTLKDKEITVLLFNADSKLLFQQKMKGNSTIDLSNETAGIYLLILEIDGIGRKEYKIIKN